MISVSTLVFGGICFGAGVIIGVVAADRDYVHTDDLSNAGKKVIDYTKTISRKIRGESPEPESQRN